MGTIQSTSSCIYRGFLYYPIITTLKPEGFSIIFVLMQDTRPIGIFDSGFGGLTVFKAIKSLMPQYDYLYLGDNARAPYGNNSTEVVYEFTLECVRWMLDKGCPLVILACNTASAEALRLIQQNDLPEMTPGMRVLGVIRPTTEIIGNYTKSNKIGILATQGTVDSNTYPQDVQMHFPEITVYQQACPMWAPMIENGEHKTDHMDKIIKEDLDNLLYQSNDIDTILLGCTHYPLVAHKVLRYLPDNITLVSQGQIVAGSLEDYLRRHNEIEELITRNGTTHFYTTDSEDTFNKHATDFFGEEVRSEHIHL